MSSRHVSVATRVAIASLALVASVSRAAIDVSASADRRTATVGEGFVLTIDIEGTPNRQRTPELPDALHQACDVFSSGTSQQTRIVNGQMDASFQYRYTLVPRAAGELTVPSIAVTVDGTVYRTEPFTITVEERRAGRSSPTARDDDAPDTLFLVATVDSDDVYEGEQVLLTVSCYYRGTIFDSDYQPPPTTGFITERLPDREPDTEVFEGVRYNVQRFRYALFPLGEGRKAIGSARLEASVPSGRRRDRFSFFGGFRERRSVVVTSEPLEITVRPLPPTDDPSFAGAVGSFDMSATLDTDTVDQNDPVTLTIRIAGQGNLGSGEAVAVPETSRFRVFDASSVTEPQLMRGRLGGTRVIERAFVPLVAGELEIPEVRFTYFDADRAAYRTLTAGPFPVTVRPGTGGGDRFGAIGKGTVELLHDDLRFIRTDAPRFRTAGDAGSGLRATAWIHLLPALGVAGAFVWRRRRERLEGDVTGRRRRGALVRAQASIDRALTEDDASALWNAVGGFLADRLDSPSSTLTAREAVAALEAEGVDPDLVKRVRSFGDQCDMKRFAPMAASGGLDPLAREARELVEALARSRSAGAPA